jgi:hypothetical protein
LIAKVTKPFRQLDEYNEEIPNILTAASLLNKRYRMDFEVNYAIHKTRLNFTNDLTLEIDIDGRDSWNVVGNQIARKFG